MKKWQALTFSIVAILLFVCTGIALSNLQLGIAIVFFLLAFVVIGFGFRFKRSRQNLKT